MTASFGEVRSIQDGADDTDACRAGGEDFVQVVQRDAANGEPRDVNMGRSPADVVKRDRGTPRLGGRGEHRSDGNVVRSGAQRVLRLLGGMSAQAELKLFWAARDLLGASEASVKEIFLPEMAKGRAELQRELGMIVDDETDAGALTNRKQFPGDALNVFDLAALGPKLDQVSATVAKLARDFLRRTPMQVGRIDKGVEVTIAQRLHVQA